jgi:hypothetical protein
MPPMLENYIATVTVSVELKRYDGKVLATYAVTRDAEGSSRVEKASAHIDTAIAKAIAASKAFEAAVDNTEARRLK